MLISLHNCQPNPSVRPIKEIRVIPRGDTSNLKKDGNRVWYRGVIDDGSTAKTYSTHTTAEGYNYNHLYIACGTDIMPPVGRK